MRKLAVFGAAIGALLACGSTASAQGYGAAGCGLGSLVFHNNDMTQILAATTNGTFASQTFGITSGTSNCSASGVIKAQREQAAFAEVNFQDLKRNMAAGGGEFLTSFATLLGCEDAAKPVLAQMTQAKYETILPTEQTGPMDLLSGVKAQIKADPRLASSCTDARALARAEGRLNTKDTKVATKPAPAATATVALTQPARTVK